MIEKRDIWGTFFKFPRLLVHLGAWQSGLGAGLKECGRRADVQCLVGVCLQPMGGEQGPWPSRGKEPLPSISTYTYAWPSIFPSNHPVTPLVSP